MRGRWLRVAALSAAATGSLALLGPGCAQGKVDLAGATVAASTAGSGGSASSGGGMGGMVVWPCGIDCSTIKPPDSCHVAQCNMTTKQCEVAALPDGAKCDDGMFCTVGETCSGGMCGNGMPNTCAMTAPTCSSIACDEASKTCSASPLNDHSPCTNPDDLCLLNPSCQNGVCTGPQNQCQFNPPPDACHVMQCDPKDGMCKPQPGNDGGACTDPAEPCTVAKTCMAGMCVGGKPKDCSALTKGCVAGVCDMVSGNCTTTPIKDGGACSSGNACKTMETCMAGQCTGGMTITQCVDNDGCCPPACNANNDSDCSCGVNLAKTATPLSSGGGQDAFGYGPKKLNDGVNQAGCMMAACSQCFCWVSNDVNPGGAYVEYDWAGKQSIGSIYVDAQTCKGTCGGNGRTVFSGKVQYWDGAQWVTAQTFINNDGPLKMNFVPKLLTDKLRIFDIAAGNCGQSMNTLIYEWGVFPGTGCTL